ncbi:MAG TPA: IclR family transcriptional regulator [Actinomycetota bacterium]|jgi:DNA-binding IclR family transcriptional regulator|nr:IclR family transcriptional regulator [Actinomycetota bacterium]
MTVSQTGVGVLDRCVAILDAVERGVRNVPAISKATGLHRATTHRLTKALEEHGFLTFVDGQGYRLGSTLLRLAATATRELPLRDLAHPVLERLAAMTGESAQLYVRDADRRVCIDAVESANELRTIVEIGASLPLTEGSAGKVFLALGPEPLRERLLEGRNHPTERELASIRRLGWAWSAGERQAGVGSVSAPVVAPHGALTAAVSVSGPANRIGRISAKRYAPAVVAAAREIERALGGL